MSEQFPRRQSADPGSQPWTVGTDPAAEPEEGGDSACWAHLVCPNCGAMTGESHRPRCESGPPED